MSQPCFYHPSVESVAVCRNCGMNICNSCIETVLGSSACQKCAPVVKDRALKSGAPVAQTQQSTQQPYYQQPASQQSPYYQQPDQPQSPYYPNQNPNQGNYNQNPYQSNYPPQQPYYDPSKAAVAKVKRAEAADVLKGLALGLIIGIIGSIIVLKILFYAHFGLSLGYIFVGYGIGWGIWCFTGKGSSGLAFGAILIYIVSLFIAHIVYANDVLNELVGSGRLEPGFSVFDVFPAVIKSFSPMHWVCMAIGLFSCYRAMEQQSD